jgi:hypothetical protein
LTIELGDVTVKLVKLPNSTVTLPNSIVKLPNYTVTLPDSVVLSTFAHDQALINEWQ